MLNSNSMPKLKGGRILIVDDEEALRFFITHLLRQAGWLVDEASSGEAALALLAERPFDVVLLDLRMAGMGGVATMQKIKDHWPETMIVIMTAYATLESAVEAVRSGAFDYLQKPCDSQKILEVTAQALAAKHNLVQTANDTHKTAVSPPQQEQPDPPPPATPLTPPIKTGQLHIYLSARQVLLAGKILPLTPTEHELISLLAQAIGKTVSLKTLIQQGLGHLVKDRQSEETLRVHISRLRNKIGPDYIHTVRGGGYMLAALHVPDSEA